MSDYLSMEEAAERLGVDYKTVYRLVRSGDLPAGKIGRAYRIRSEELDAYFDRQKQLLAEGAGSARRPAPAAMLCGGCGKQMLSQLSMAGRCGQCGAPVCQACWSIRKVRQCASHQTPGEVSTAAAAAERAREPRAKPQAGGVVDRELAVARLKQEGKPVVTAAEARLCEETFLRSFGQRLEHIEELPDPLSKHVIPLRKARVRHVIEPTYRGSDDLPANQVSRFTLRSGGWGKPKACLVLEARFVSRPEALKSQGYDAEPIGEAELTPLLNDLAAEAKKGGCFRVVVFGSPTGWTETAARMITHRRHRSAFHDRGAAVAIWDLHAGAACVDETDQRLWAFWPFLVPARYAARVAECVATVGGILVRKNSLALDDAMRACKADPTWVRTAFEELERAGEFTLDELPDIGLVISRRSA